MKTHFFKLLLIYFFYSVNIEGQVFFQENFSGYSNFQDFKSQNYPNGGVWTLFHAENKNFNTNPAIESFERIKTTSIVQNFGNGGKSIRFDLRRMNGDLVDEFYQFGTFYGDSATIGSGEFYNHITRNEIATYDYPGVTTFKPDEEYWFSYDIFVPDNDTEYLFETQNCNIQDSLNYELVGQWHLTNQTTSTFAKPPLSLQIHCNKWVISQNPVSDGESGVVKNIISDVEKGQWINWKFNVIFSTSNEGKLEVWKNGNLVHSISGQTLPVEIPVYFKIGVYKPHWWSRSSSTIRRVVYYDNVQIYKTTSLIESDCQKQLSASDMTLTADTLENENPSYHFRIDSNATGSSPATSNHIHTNPNELNHQTIDLKSYDWVQPNRHYFVKVMVDNHPSHYTYPERPCEVDTPGKIHIGLIDADCGRVLTNSNREITCETVPGNPQYHFRIDSNAHGSSPATSNHVYSDTPKINLADYSWFQPNRVYYVKVKIDHRPMFDQYADIPCEIIWNSGISTGPIKANKEVPIIYPNPIQGNTINILINDSEEIIEKAQLFSLNKNQEVPLKLYKNEIQLAKTSLEKGIYNLILKTNKDTYELKVINK